MQAWGRDREQPPIPHTLYSDQATGAVNLSKSAVSEAATSRAEDLFPEQEARTPPPWENTVTRDQRYTLT